MALHRVGARRLAGDKAVVNVPPMIGRDLGRIDISGLDHVDELEHALHLRPPSTRSRVSPPGVTVGIVWQVSPRLTQRRMSSRESTVPCSFAAQRTSANVEPGRKKSTRRRRSRDLFVRLASEADPVLDLLLDPDQFDLGEIIEAATRGRGRRARDAAARPSLGVSLGWWEFALEQRAQHVGDRLAARKAAILIRPRMSAVTSMVSLAEKRRRAQRAAPGDRAL